MTDPRDYQINPDNMAEKKIEEAISRIDPNKPIMHVIVDPYKANRTNVQMMTDQMKRVRDLFKDQFNIIFTPVGFPEIRISTMPVIQLNISNADDVPKVLQRLIEEVEKIKSEKGDDSNGGA